MAPIISLALGLGKLSVGPPYFNPTFLISMLPLLALLAVGIHARWKRGGLGGQGRTLLLTLAAAALVGCVTAIVIFHGRGVLAPVGMTLGTWIIFSSLIDPIERLRRRIAIPRAVLGMTIAHIALGIFVFAMTAVQGFTAERDVALANGASARAGGYTFQFEGVGRLHGRDYGGSIAKVIVTRDGRAVAVMHPATRMYWVQHTVTTKSAILFHDGSNILVALGQNLGDGRWSLRLQVRPLVSFIWIAALIMAFGGLLAITDRRYRIEQARVEETVAALAGGKTP
jgi:cytochrome c-type biogenesis protein CcmF